MLGGTLEGLAFFFSGAAANIVPSDFVPTAASAIFFCVPLSLTGKVAMALSSTYLKAFLL